MTVIKIEEPTARKESLEKITYQKVRAFNFNKKLTLKHYAVFTQTEFYHLC